MKRANGANMIRLHGDEYEVQFKSEGVMKRSVEGIIDLWNQAAEELYGWKKEEAIGRVSHELLQTEFPQSLEEIESELIERGRWEGKLVHTTRQGDRVIVESRWILNNAGDPESVVEINTPIPERDKRDNVLLKSAGSKARPGDNTVRVSAYIGLMVLIAGWVFYLLCGHQLIEDTYNGRAIIPFLNSLMEGRGSTRIENYHQAADQLMLLGTIGLIATYLTIVFLLKRPIGALLAAFSFLVMSFLVFCLFELAPSLVKPLGLDAIPYYAHKLTYIEDDALIFREKPFNRVIHENYRTDQYSALYGIEVPPVYFEWITDKNGFRNGQTRDYSDIIAIGDSYLEWGNTEADTFVKRLEDKLPGLTITNLGKSGYGPPQYLEVLNRYGVNYRPKYAVMGFFEGNDVPDTEAYFRWKKGQTEQLSDFHRQAQLSFFQRYWLSMESQATFIRANISYWIKLALNKIAQRQGYAHDVHPELAVLKLGDSETYKIRFVEQLDTRSPKEMLASEEWRQLKTVLTDVRDVCEKNGISLIVMYIPAAAHIYAEYSTKQSGETWLQIRDQQIHAKHNTEEAMRQMAEELDIEIISFTPVLEEAARQGKLLYYPLDPHWNPEGTEVAARYMAETLKSRYLSRPSPAH
jgi:PAS domain S-box-containing protein